MFGPDGRIERRFVSTNLPLGIARNSDGVRGVERFTWERPAQLLLLSDGVPEASRTDGAAFGEDGLPQVLAQPAGDSSAVY